MLSDILHAFCVFSGVKSVGRVISGVSVGRGVATGWTGVNMSTPLLPEVVPEIDANPVSFYTGGGGVEPENISRTTPFGECTVTHTMPNQRVYYQSNRSPQRERATPRRCS